MRLTARFHALHRVNALGPGGGAVETVSSYSYEAHIPIHSVLGASRICTDDEEAPWRDFLAVMRSCLDPLKPHNSAVTNEARDRTEADEGVRHRTSGR